MSNLFYNSRVEKKPKTDQFTDTKRVAKLGTKAYPLTLVVSSQERKDEIEAILAENSLIADIELDADAKENTLELDGILNKPKPTVFEKTPKRNDPCSCGSGKKYKKCCG